MPPKAPETLIRKSISLPERLWAEVWDFRFSWRFGSEAEAVRRLLQAGLAAERRGARTVKPRRKR
jgi:hypothetical protein